MSDSIRLRVKRQDGPDATPYWEHFEVPDHAGANVVSADINETDGRRWALATESRRDELHA